MSAKGRDHMPTKKSFQENAEAAQTRSQKALEFAKQDMYDQGLCYPTPDPKRSPIENYDAMQAYSAKENVCYHKHLKALALIDHIRQSKNVVSLNDERYSKPDYHDRY